MIRGWKLSPFWRQYYEQREQIRNAQAMAGRMEQAAVDFQQKLLLLAQAEEVDGAMRIPRVQ